MTERRSIRVSVIVPVFQPGPSFDDLVESLDAQALDASRFEVLLCDDGSGEPTASRLAAVARARPFVRVLSLPHSGWPGTPRNCGIDAARGEYVYFVDQDDRLFPRALQALCDFADAHGSDVVIGREVGIGRSLPRRIFRRDVPRARLGEDPLLELLTPHKMFRTSFLREHGIRFPDGRVRLEDHLFVLRAYFDARTISILAAEPCYAWVKHPGSASSSRIDPGDYFPHLDAVLDLVESRTDPGPLRDRLLRHWYRGKILRRLAGRRMLRYPDEYRSRFLDVVQPIVARRFGPGVDDGLALPDRVRSALLRADRRDDLLALARWETDVECRAALVSAKWTRGGGLDLAVDVRISVDGRTDIAIEHGASARDRLVWVPPAGLGDLPENVRDVTAEVRNDRVELMLRDATDGTERLLARAASVASPARFAIDPLRVFGRSDPSRGGTIVANVRRAGWTFTVPVTAGPVLADRLGPSPFLAGHPCTLESSGQKPVELRRQWPRGRGRDLAGRAVRRLRARLRSR